jgi:type IV pilus assembly protein PilQ
VVSNIQRVDLTIPAALLTALLMVAGCATTGPKAGAEGPKKAPAAADAKSALVVKDIRTADGITVTIEGSQPLTYSVFRLDNPLRVALDLPGADLAQITKNIPINRGFVSFIKPLAGEAPKGKAPVGRVEIFLAKPASHDVKSVGNVLTIVLAEAKEAKGTEEITVAPAAKAEAPAKAPAAKEEVKVASAPPPEAPKAAEPAKTEAPAAAPAETAGKGATRVSILDVSSSPQGTQVTIEGDGRLDYEYFLVEGKSIVVDVYGVTNGIAPLSRKVADGYVKQLRVGEHFEPKKKVRVVLDLVKPAEYKLVAMGNKILVNFGALAKESDEKLRDTLSNVVTDVFFRPLDDRSILEVATSRTPDFQKVESDDPNRLIVEVNNSRITPEAQKTLELGALNREVVKVVSFQYKRGDVPVVRIVLQFRDKAPYRIDTAGNRVIIEVPRAKSAVPAVAVAAPAAPVPNGAVAPAAPAAPAQEAAPAAEQKKYSGKKLTLDFKDADITDVLRLIAEVSGINFVSGTDVKGKVTIKMNDVPWDQALEVILKTNDPQLSQVREAENIIRITTILNIRREEDDRQRIEKSKIEVAKTQMALEPLVTKSFQISYAKVKDILPRVEKFQSERKKTDGLLEADDRTNTLIVRDLQANVDEVEKVIRQLDTPTPAVQIEARIVSVSSNYSKDLGIQWGMNLNADPAHGNATPFQFPNSVNVSGNAQGFMVNLPASAPTAGIGIALGSIANTLALDLRLSAMESKGQVEILSNPKIFVVQNEKAIINVGRQLPVPKTDAEGNRTVEFKDVGIKLEVTPQVTADNRIFLDVQVERSDKGEDVKTTDGEQFSINTERAQTKVLLNDGETSVIGGMFQQNKSVTNQKVPGLGGLPFIGWLFRSKSDKDSRTELLIFLTPKIVLQQ